MTTRRLSVLYFTNAIARGGAEEHMLTLIRGLDRSIFAPLLACPKETASALESDLPEDTELFRLRLRSPLDVRAALTLARLLRARRVDILHAHLFYSSLFAAPVGWACRVPVIIETPHVREQWRKGWKSRFLVDRIASKFVDHYVAVSEANALYLEKVKELPGRKIVRIANGCDVSRFVRTPGKASGLRRALGFGETEPVLVVVGRLEPQKGHGILLDALPAVLREFPKARLVCVGEGGLREELENRVRAAGLDQAVRFVGYQSRVEEWLALGALTVLPSHYEGLPLVAIESLAAERTVVATAVDGTPEVVIDRRTGLTVPPGDPSRLAEAICYLLGNPAENRRLARAGREWVTAHFNQDRQVERTQALYLQAYEKARRRSRAAENVAPVVRESVS